MFFKTPMYIYSKINSILLFLPQISHHLRVAETKTFEGLVVFKFGKWWRHLKTGNYYIHFLSRKKPLSTSLRPIFLLFNSYNDDIGTGGTRQFYLPSVPPSFLLIFSTSTDRYIKRLPSPAPKSEQIYLPSGLFLCQWFLFVGRFCTRASVYFLTWSCRC